MAEGVTMEQAAASAEPVVEEASRPWRGWAGWMWLGVWVLLALAVTLATIAYSLRYGRLSAPPDWDDVMYMQYAAARVNDLHAGGLWKCVVGWVHNTPHSPWSCGVAFVMFVLCGVRDWPPYLGSVVVVLGFLVLADWVMGRQQRQRAWVRVLTGSYLCTIPMLTLAVANFKPDIPWGLGVGAVAAVCALRPIVGARARVLAGVGVLCALATLAKPSTTPGTIALLGLCGLVGTVKDVALARRWPGVWSLARCWAWVLGVMAVCVGPFYFLNWEYFTAYIQQALFGEYRATWYAAGGWPAQFKYYLTGLGGQANLAGHLYLLAAVWVVGWGMALARRDVAVLVRATGLLVLTGACYMVPTLNAAKNDLLASPFYALAIVTTAYWIGYLSSSAAGSPRERAWNWTVTVGLVVMVVAGSLLYRWPSKYYGPGGADRADSARLHGEVYEALLKQVRPYSQRTAVMAVGPVRGITLSWYATRDRKPLTFERPFSSKVSDYVPYADRADFVLAQEDHVRGGAPYAPNEQGDVQSRVLEMMRHREDFRELSEFTAADGKKLVLFQRTRWASEVMSGVRAMEGFGPEQGPYPTSNPPLPRFCWGTGKESDLVLTPEWKGEAATLRVECRTTDRAQAVRVVSGGVVLGTHRFERPWVSETFEVAVPRAEAGQELKLEYEGRGAPRPWSSSENSAMYTKVELVPAAGK